MPERVRLNFHLDDRLRLIVIRPIGNFSSTIFTERSFEAFRSVASPWLYNRVYDFRRYDIRLSMDDVRKIAKQWADLTAGQDYHANVAVVSNAPDDKLRLPSNFNLFPHETICHFADFHQGVGWLMAPDKAHYLAHCSSVSPAIRDDGPIIII